MSKEKKKGGSQGGEVEVPFSGRYDAQQAMRFMKELSCCMVPRIMRSMRRDVSQKWECVKMVGVGRKCRGRWVGEMKL